jgi:hypothetical protein
VRDLDAIAAYRGVADRILFDAKPPRDATRPGGNGEAFDWTLLGCRRNADAADPRPGARPMRTPRPIRLSGRTSGLNAYAGRPSPLYFAERLTEELGGAKIYFKRDELNHTGSHKINNCLGQILLARRMGKTAHHRRDRRRPAWRGNRHGLRPLRLPCEVYMGATDVERQAPNVFRMKLLGAKIIR